MIWRLSELEAPLSLYPLQEGFQVGQSCPHTTLILQEGINALRESRSKAYAASLDIRLAFGTVLHAALLVMLHRKV